MGRADGGGTQRVRVYLRRCSGYRHRDGCKEFIDKKGRLVKKPVKIEGPISPGSVVRHTKFPADTKIEEPPGHALCLFFALVGCLALPARGGVGVLLVPEVTDLKAFAESRPPMTLRCRRWCGCAAAC